MANNAHIASGGRNKRSALRWLLPLLGLSLIGVVALIVAYKRGVPAYTYTAWAGPIKECTYLGSRTYNNVMVDLSNCGTIDANGVLRLDRKLLRSMKFNGERPECIRAKIDKGLKYFYVDKAGDAIETLQNYSDEPDCDEFSDGLARSPSPDGIRFVDRSLHVVIPASYQYAFRFTNGYAAVCNDLRIFMPFHDVDGYGMYVGGHCGYIDKRGKLVVPMDYDGDDIFSHEPLPE